MNEIGYTVTRLTKEEIPTVAELERLCFREPWSEDALRLLLGEEAVGAVAKNDAGEVLGYAGMWLSPFEGEVTEVAVFPESRRRGVGKALLSFLDGEAKERGLEQISLEVRASNEAAIALYRGCGYEAAGVRKRFYKDPPEDAIVMVKKTAP